VANNFSDCEYDILRYELRIFLSHSDVGGLYLLLENALVARLII